MLTEERIAIRFKGDGKFLKEGVLHGFTALPGGTIGLGRVDSLYEATLYPGEIHVFRLDRKLYELNIKEPIEIVHVVLETTIKERAVGN